MLSAAVALSDTVRVATFNVSLGRRGPGVLLKAIMSDKDPQVAEVIAIIQHVRPDILLLNEFDTDFTNLALTDFRRAMALGEAGIVYPFSFAPIGNEGVPSGLDLDQDGKPGEWADAFGFGRFPGSQGMALLSRFPITTADARSFSTLKWLDLTEGSVPLTSIGEPLLSEAIAVEMRLSAKSHWDVPVVLPSGASLHILASHPTPPVFDGEENLNGLRNNAEIVFWVSYLDGVAFRDDNGRLAGFSDTNFVLLGDLNNDPADGEGQKAALSELLTHRLIQDPQQRSQGALLAAARYGGVNLKQLGDPVFDTVEWEADIGNMRVDYALPAANLAVSASGVFWPAPDDPGGDFIGEGREGASNHRLVWVDIAVN